MMTTERTLREVARALPLHERHRRMATVHAASDAALLRAVLAAGLGADEWHSTGDFAERAGVTPRRMRRMIEDDAVILAEPMRTMLERYAFAFGVEL